MKQTVLFCLFLGLVFPANVAQSKAQSAEDPYVIIVELSFDEQQVDSAIDLLLEGQALTLENEEGCIIYDVLLSETDPNTVFIYESYENEAAYKIHENSAYYKSILKNKLNPLIKKSRVTKVIPLNQQDDLVDEEL
jgi:quinol monooxygenase YgiN